MENIKKCELILQKYRVISDKYKICKLNKNKHLKEIRLFKETSQDLYLEYMHHFLKIFTQRINLPKDFGVLEIDGFEDEVLDGVKELLKVNDEDIINHIFYLLIECEDINNVDKYGNKISQTILDVANDESSFRYGFSFSWYDEIFNIIKTEKELNIKGTYFNINNVEKVLNIFSNTLKELKIICENNVDTFKAIKFNKPRLTNNKAYKFNSKITKLKYIDKYSNNLIKDITKNSNLFALLEYLTRCSLGHHSFDKGLIPCINFMLEKVQYSIGGVLCYASEVDVGILAKYLCVHYGYLDESNPKDAAKQLLNSFLKIKKKVLPSYYYNNFFSKHLLRFSQYLDRVEELKKIVNHYRIYKPNEFYCELKELSYKEFEYVLRYNALNGDVIKFYNVYLKSLNSLKIDLFIKKYKDENIEEVTSWENTYLEEQEKKRIEEENRIKLEEQRRIILEEENKKKQEELERLNKQKELLKREETKFDKKEIEALKKECELDYSKAFKVADYYFKLGHKDKRYFIDAIKYYTLSAEVGNVAGMNNVAISYLNLVKDEEKDYQYIEKAISYLYSKKDKSWRVLYCYMLLLSRKKGPMIYGFPQDVKEQYELYMNNPNLKEIEKDLLSAAYYSLEAYISHINADKALDIIDNIKDKVESVFLVERFIEGFTRIIKKLKTIKYAQCCKYISILEYFHNIGVISASLDLASFYYYGFPTTSQTMIKHEEVYNLFGQTASVEKEDMYRRQQLKNPLKTYQILSAFNGDYGVNDKVYYDDLMLKAKGKIGQ